MGFRKYNFFKKFLDFLTGFAAFLTVLLILFNLVCAKFGFLEGSSALDICAKAEYYLVPSLILLAGLEWFSTKNWFFLIVYILIAAVAAIWMFQPAWIDAFFNLFQKG